MASSAYKSDEASEKSSSDQDQRKFSRLRRQLQAAFAAPEEIYVTMSASDVIRRNRRHTHS